MTIEVINVLPQHMKEIIEISDKAAFCLGSTFGQLSGLLDKLKTMEMTQDEVHKEVYDIWENLRTQVNDIYYKDLQKK